MTIDTLRADRLGTYGASDVATPALDRLAREGARFDAAYAVAPLTLPSHVSMLSGWLPAAHGVRTNDAFTVAPGVPLAAEALAEAGYDTAAFVGAFVLARRTGIDRGFTHFDDEVGAAGERRGEEVVRRAAEWLSRRESSRPFFMWVHLFDPHLDYDPPEPYRSRYAGRAYDGEVAYADACVAALLAVLEEQRLMTRTAIVAAADHGEALGDHGERSHGATLYESVVRVPLIVRPLRGAGGATIATPVSTAAVAPTILEFAGVRRSPERSVSLLRYLETASPAQHEPVISETLYLRLLLGWTPLYSARVGSHKVIDAPSPELYDVAADPAESTNLAPAQPKEAARLRDTLRRELAAAASAGVPPGRAPTDAGAREKLAALGYVSSGRAQIQPVEPVGGPDIASRLPLWLQIEQALERSQKGDLRRAEEIFEAVLRSEPGNVLALKFLGARALEAGDLKRAVVYNERVIAAGLHVGEALSNLALAFSRLGRAADALKAADAAVAQDPDSVAARANRALILLEAGRTAQAVQEADEVLRRDPQHTGAQQIKKRAQQGGAADAALPRIQALAAGGDLHAAVAEAERALRERPSDPALLDLLGVLLARSGDNRRAIAAFERALALSPDNPDILERLGAVRHRAGDLPAARVAFERVVALDPARQAPRLSLAILDLEEGRPQRAAARLDAISSGWPGAYQAQFYLAEARQASGDAAGARDAYRACLSMAPPDSPLREAAARRLAALR